MEPKNRHGERDKCPQPSIDSRQHDGGLKLFKNQVEGSTFSRSPQKPLP